MLSLPLWLVYALPPLLGAIIGYVTNALAIRMLFRPLSKKYFLGIPIPLTPGIIPRQRESLAHSIARMVSKSLFNADVVIGHIKAEKFQTALKVQLEELFFGGKSAADNSAPSSSTSDEEEARQFIHLNISRVESLILPMLKAPMVRQLLRLLLERISGQIGGKRLGDFLPVSARDKNELSDMLDRFIRGKAYKRFKWMVILWLQRQVDENVSLEKLLSPALLRRAIHIVDRMYIPIVNFLMDFLRRPDIRKELVKRGKIVMSDILMKLNPVQRIMISAGQYDRTLEENMPDIVRDLLRTLEKALREAENRERLILALHEFLRGIQQQGLADLEQNYSIHLTRLSHRILGSAREIMLREHLAEKIAEFIAARSSGENAPSFDQLLASYANMSFADLAVRLYDSGIRWIDDDDMREKLKNGIADIMFRSHTEKRLSSLTDSSSQDEQVPAELQENMQQNSSAQDERFAQSLASGITLLIEGAVPSLIEKFNMYQMVVDRINSLDILEVEELLLGIIARHLKYINIFGAVLGALIGGAQLLLRFI